MLIRLEQTEKDETLGYKWVEIYGIEAMFRIRNGLPECWLIAKVRTESDTRCRVSGKCIHMEDIMNVIKYGEYIVTKCEGFPGKPDTYVHKEVI
jgi:hypothetical protein